MEEGPLGRVKNASVKGHVELHEPRVSFLHMLEEAESLTLPSQPPTDSKAASVQHDATTIPVSDRDAILGPSPHDILQPA